MADPRALVLRRGDNARVRRLQLRVHHVDADFEIVDRGPRGAGTDLPGREVFVHGATAEQDVRGIAVVNRGVAAVDRRLPLRVPVVLERRASAPGLRQLDIASEAVDAVGQETEAALAAIGLRVVDAASGVHDRALGPVELGLEVITNTEHRRIHAQTGADGITEHVARVGRQVGSIVLGAGVMDRTGDLSAAPSLVNAQVADEVRHLVANAARRRRRGNESGRVGDLRDGATARIFHADCRRQTVAELSGISEKRLATVAGVRAARGPNHTAVIRHGRVVHEVVERLRTTSGEAGELDERTVGVEGRRGRDRRVRRVVAREADRDVRAQGAVFGLRAGIGRDVATVTGVEVSGRTVCNVGDHRTVGHVAGVAVGRLHTNPAANLDASIGARDVIETRTVQATNLHVLTYDYRIASDSACL